MHTSRFATAMRWTVRAVAVAYTAFVLWFTLRPTLEDMAIGSVASAALAFAHSIGIGAWFDYDALEFTANVGMFVVLGVVWALAWPWRGRAVAVMLAALVGLSVLIETVQGVFLPGRVADVRDIVANGVGGIAGFTAVVLVRRRTMKASSERNPHV